MFCQWGTEGLLKHFKKSQVDRKAIPKISAFFLNVGFYIHEGQTSYGLYQLG